MHRLRHQAKAQNGRLLCVLFLRLGAVSTDSGAASRRAERRGVFAVERSRYKKFVPSRRIKKTLIARCMIGKSRQTRISRFEGAYYAQYSFSCRSCGSSRSHLFVARTGDSRERSNRRWRRRRTYRRCIARWGPGVTPCSAAGLLCAGAGIRGRARVPVRSRTLLGRLRLGIPPRRGLRLIVRCTDQRLPRKCEERTTLARRFE
jgi:hypothetical protein